MNLLDPIMLAKIANYGKMMNGGIGGHYYLIPLLNGEELRVDMYEPDVMPKDDPHYAVMSWEIKDRFIFEAMISTYEYPPIPEVEDTGDEWAWSIGHVPEDTEPTEVVLGYVFRKPKIRSKRFLSIDKTSTVDDFEEALVIARMIHAKELDD